MTMPKILYCITKGNFGGAQKYVYDLATHIDKSQYEAVLVCAAGEGDTLPKKLAEKGIRFITLTSLYRDINIVNELKSFVELYRIFKKEKPDIIHLNSSKMGGTGAFIGRLAGVKKIVFTAHGFAFNEDRSFISKKISLFFHYLTILLTHQTIIVSKKTMKDIDYLPFIKNKLVKIYNGIDITLDFETKETARATLHLPDTFTLLSIGELHTNKGYDLFIPSLKNIQTDFVYAIIGAGEEQANLQKIIDKHGLTDKVKMLGRIADAYKYIKASDIFILPSRTEAFPYVLLESGLSQSAVLASRVGGIPEIIIENETGLMFDPHDSDELTTKLKTLMENEELREKLARNIHEKVVQDFSIDKMMTETVAVYRL